MTRENNVPRIESGFESGFAKALDAGNMGLETEEFSELDPNARQLLSELAEVSEDLRMEISGKRNRAWRKENARSDRELRPSDRAARRRNRRDRD